MASGSGAILAWQVYGPVMCGLQLRTLRFRRCHRRPARAMSIQGSADTGRDLSGDAELEGRDNHLGERSDPSIRGAKKRILKHR